MLGWLGAASIVLCAGGARADSPPAPADQTPSFKFNLLETLDFWDNASGGMRTGGTVISKLRVSATWNAAQLGDAGFTAHAQVFVASGRGVSANYVGDTQNISNIEAPDTVRLFTLYGEQSFGDKGSLRVGLLDVNHDFDINYPVGLFIASSAAIGPELSKSGQNGPSNYPVSALGARWIWTPNSKFTLRTAVFDGVAGDPAHQSAFVIVRMRPDDGAFLIGQADWNFADNAQASVGVWGYTQPFDRIDPARPGQEHQAGVYVFVDGPITKSLAGWVRAGVSNAAVEQVSSFVGAGLVWSGPIPGRKDDQAGLAIERAGIGAPAQHLQHLPDAETSIEATYAFAATDHLTIQPDVQYVIHPALAPHLPNALAFGLRFVVNLNAPAGATDTED